MSNDDRLLLIDKTQVETLLRPNDVLQAVREAFILHSQRKGRLFPVIRERLNTGGIFGIKAGDVQDRDLLGFKAAGFWPSNRAHGGEPHQATILLFDPATGRPLCVIDGNAITTMRTAAAGALGLTQLARRDAAQVCIFGTGVQARTQLERALKTMPGLRSVLYVTANDRRNRAFETPFLDDCDIRHAAVARSDVVITATPGNGPLFNADAVRPGTHLTCVGADTKGKRELPAGLLETARLFVDDRAQARRIGETQWAPRTPCTELGALLCGKRSFVRRPDDITVFDMTGLALQDLIVAQRLYERAQDAGTATAVAWPW